MLFFILCYYISRFFITKAAPIIVTTETTESAAAEPHPPQPLSTAGGWVSDSLSSVASVFGASVSGASVSGASVSGSGTYFTSNASASALSFETSILLRSSTVVASSRLFMIASYAAEYLE